LRKGVARRLPGEILPPPQMSATAIPPTFAHYRDAVHELLDAGEPFGGVEEVIESCELGDDLKAALWLMAYFNDGSVAPE
jgi:hypothetical protein